MAEMFKVCANARELLRYTQKVCVTAAHELDTRDRRRARQCRCIYKKQHKALSFSVSQNTRPVAIMLWA